jgi:hypothetical protein
MLHRTANEFPTTYSVRLLGGATAWQEIVRIIKNSLDKAVEIVREAAPHD